jgi:hypothetical protein
MVGRTVPRRTASGCRVLGWVKGFEGFPRGTDPAGLDEPARQRRFESLLPYALALGLEVEWTRAFEGRVEPPAWWRGSGGQPEAGHLSRGLCAASRSLVAAMGRAPRSAVSLSRLGGGLDLGSDVGLGG